AVPDLTALQLPLLRRWMAEQSAQGLSRATLARRVAAVRSFTAWAHRTGRLSSDPGARLLSPRPDATVPHVLAADHATALLEAAQQRVQDLDQQVQQGHYTGRSEEHTSELQSRFDLVCRRLLEKQNPGQKEQEGRS